MRRFYLVVYGLAGLLGIAAANSAGCSAAGERSTFGEGGGGESSGNGTGNNGQGAATSTESGAFVTSSSGGPTTCGDVAADDDQDGFSEAAGDCNDCKANISPGSLEVINSDPAVPPEDDDCDGLVDNVAASTCDDNLALTDPDPYNAARAIDLCQMITPSDKKWGVLNARYVRAEGAPTVSGLQNGIMTSFGQNVNPQGGKRLLALSTGRARVPGQAGECGLNSCWMAGPGSPPIGFPQSVPICGNSSYINDDIGLEVRVRAPTNSTGFKFKFKFYSFEYPQYVCTPFNDQFIALVIPSPVGSINGNVSFDQMTNPVSVNLAFFDVCDGCPSGTGEMVGTGFNEWDFAGGATSWLQSQAPVKGGDEITLRFTLWDTRDQEYDSTALVDGFEWLVNGTVPVETEPIPDPK